MYDLIVKLISSIAEIVSENFFGGFKDKSDDGKKNRKDWIEEMIAKSKQAKV